MVSSGKLADSYEKPAKWHVWPKDYVLSSLFVVLWLIPMGYRGLAHDDLAPWLPNWLTYFHNASCLFTDSVDSWSAFYVEGLPEGSELWEELPDYDYSPMEPFGHRARIDRMIANFAARRGELSERQMLEMAVWMRAMHKSLHPDGEGLQAVRFVRVRYLVGEELASAKGHWENKPLRSVPEEKRDVIASVSF